MILPLAWHCAPGQSRPVETFDPSSTAELRKQAKRALRKRMNALRKALPATAVQKRSAKIVERLLHHSFVADARAVGLYAAMPDRGEVDLSELHNELHTRGVRLYYPFMDPSDAGYTTGLRLWRPGDRLLRRSHYFDEPDPNAPVAERGDLDVVIVPALGVTLSGDRLGFGAGFYDATLPDVCPPAKTICIGYDFQLLVELPTEPHDFKCDAVVTDKP